MEITIDPEFKALIPPLAADELRQLEENILRDGCRDPLVVWNNILIDGHNRHEICTRNGLPFETVQIQFESRTHARIWMRNNQAGRRNLSTAWRLDLELGNKKDLLEIGKAKRVETLKQNAAVLSENDKTASAPPINTQKEIAKAAGVSTGQVGMAEQIIKKAPELWEKAKQGDVSISTAYQQIRRIEKEAKREARREENRAKVSEAQAPEDIIKSEAKFATIVIDPPWDWGDEGDQDQMGRARPDYATMSKEQLMALPVGTLADDDCHLYMWITNRSLPKGFDLIQAWGFRYITAITWAKPSFGMGNYFRGQTEQILFAVKGSQPLKRKDVGTLFTAPRGPNGHSSKPVEFYDLVESCSPGPFLEMFSRHNREGWTAWGEGQ
ncbi:MAG: MT-A70 family methyltransferase [Verrucomicrobia bacterium]|nr:MT-A70 family methyltransferase [Verrucomicrobiota bacterium]